MIEDKNWVGPEIHITQIPVYRCTPEQFEIEEQAQAEKYGKPRSGARMWYDQEVFFPQQFNDVVAWVRIYALGSQIRAEDWWVRSKHIVRKMRHRNFIWNGKVFEISFDKNDDQETIRTKLLDTLRECLSEGNFKKRYVDLTGFIKISHFINWRQLLGLDND